MSDERRLRVAVDWLRCEGRGLCAELLPEHIGLDDWGFPVVTGELDPSVSRLARRAINACPRLALRLEEQQSAAPPGAPAATASRTVLPSRPARGRQARR